VTTLDVVKVTARKREESLQDVPVAVTALTAEQLDKLAIKDLGDLQGQVPNLTIYAARGSNTTITTFIRGVGQADPLWGVDPGVGIYFDDVYIAARRARCWTCTTCSAWKCCAARRARCTARTPSAAR
jgi:iron complex outermembrane receptor protein